MTRTPHSTGFTTVLFSGLKMTNNQRHDPTRSLDLKNELARLRRLRAMRLGSLDNGRLVQSVITEMDTQIAELEQVLAELHPHPAPHANTQKGDDQKSE